MCDKLALGNATLQVGRQEPVMVLRVDKEKGYIDLSKRRVAAEDIQVAYSCDKIASSATAPHYPAVKSVKQILLAHCLCFTR